MLDTTSLTTAITKLITSRVSEGELLVRVTRQFPNLSPAELSQALQVATSEAERMAAGRH